MHALTALCYLKHWNRKSEISRGSLDCGLTWLYTLSLPLSPLSFDHGGFGEFGNVDRIVGVKLMGRLNRKPHVLDC